MASSRICSIEGCGKPLFNKGWCASHFARWRDRGDPLGEKVHKICSVADCDKPFVAHGFCERHYRRWSQYGDPLGRAPVKPKRKCLVADCSKPHEAHGYCSTHYTRWRKHGDPLFGSEILKRGRPLNFLENVVIPHKDSVECLTWPFARSSEGYGKIGYNGKSVAVHRLVCKMVHGPAPTDKHEAAHLCGKGHLACCNPHHLCWKTPKENCDDQVVHGTRRYGSRHQNSKLTESDVRQIRALKGTMTQRAIGELFGVSAATIGAIHKGIRWSWLD